MWRHWEYFPRPTIAAPSAAIPWCWYDRPPALRLRTFVFFRKRAGCQHGFAVTGPGDVVVIAKKPIGLGIVRLTLQLPAIAIPSARTLFIQNANLDKTAASGSLWVR